MLLKIYHVICYNDAIAEYDRGRDTAMVVTNNNNNKANRMECL